MMFFKLRIQDETVQKGPDHVASQCAHCMVRLWFKQQTKMGTYDPRDRNDGLWHEKGNTRLCCGALK